MKIVVRRKTKTNDAYLGNLEVAGSFNCYSLENLTLAIPTGSYSVEITNSPHFGRPMPLLVGVLGRTDIRIHPANWPTQLEGCIAVGQSHDVDDLNNSDAAFEPLFTQISKALAAGEPVTVEIIDETIGAAPFFPKTSGTEESRPAIRPGILEFLANAIQQALRFFQSVNR